MSRSLALLLCCLLLACLLPAAELRLVAEAELQLPVSPVPKSHQNRQP